METSSEKLKNFVEDKIKHRTKTLNKMFNKDDGEFSAEMAWLSTTYGVEANRPIEERIANKQKDIMNVIKSKFPFSWSKTNSELSRCIDVKKTLPL